MAARAKQQHGSIRRRWEGRRTSALLSFTIYMQISGAAAAAAHFCLLAATGSANMLQIINYSFIKIIIFWKYKIKQMRASRVLVNYADRNRSEYRVGVDVEVKEEPVNGGRGGGWWMRNLCEGGSALNNDNNNNYIESDRGWFGEWMTMAGVFP